MCGRVTQDGSRGIKSFPVKLEVPDGFEPRYNLAPTDPLLTITPEWTYAVRRWGLVPSWAKGLSIGSKTFNARAETVAEKPSFRTPFKRKRCLIPVSGFYEWHTQGKTKTPFYISHVDPKQALVFAGLWDSWESEDGELQSCTVITTAANAFMEELHDRMPVILGPGQWEGWLAADAKPADLQAMLKPCPTEWLQAWQVRPLRGEGPQLCAPQS